jgi:hypothetical protein
MIEWFRWWHGTVTDPKFRWIAKKSNSKVTDVLAVWAALLEHASNVTQCNADETRGNVASFQCEDWDIQFDLEEGQTQKILSAMESKGLIKDSEIYNWEKRQPKREDSSTERVRRFRERKKALNNIDDETQCNAKKRQETLDTDTDKYTDKEKNKDLITTSNSHIHSLARDFFALFAADGFYIDKVNGNQQTVDMVHAWIAAGVTLEEAKTVIAQTKAKRGNRPSSPTYYRDIVLDAKRAGIAVVDKSFQEKIKNLFLEILPEYPINVWTEKAAQDLQARIEAKYDKFDFKKLKTWRNFFLIVKCSTHIKKHEWHLDYLVQEKNFANILNNKRQVDLEQYEKLKQQYEGSPEGLN